jgi:hypothetical protein
LFLSSFVFPLLFLHYFIHVSLAHVVSSLAYPNLLGTKKLGCCCCCCWDVLNALAVCRVPSHQSLWKAVNRPHAIQHFSAGYAHAID